LIIRRAKRRLGVLSYHIIDTTKPDNNGESTGDIWIAFIELPATRPGTPGGLSAARHLAAECGPPKPDYFKYEVVFG
jgi:hypothetical protein